MGAGELGLDRVDVDADKVGSGASKGAPARECFFQVERGAEVTRLGATPGSLIFKGAANRSTLICLQPLTIAIDGIQDSFPVANEGRPVASLAFRSQRAQRFAALQSHFGFVEICLLYTSPSPRDRQKSRMPSSA